MLRGIREYISGCEIRILDKDDVELLEFIKTDKTVIEILKLISEKTKKPKIKIKTIQKNKIETGNSGTCEGKIEVDGDKCTIEMTSENRSLKFIHEILHFYMQLFGNLDKVDIDMEEIYLIYEKKLNNNQIEHNVREIIRVIDTLIHHLLMLDYTEKFKIDKDLFYGRKGLEELSERNDLNKILKILEQTDVLLINNLTYIENLKNNSLAIYEASKELYEKIKNNPKDESFVENYKNIFNIIINFCKEYSSVNNFVNAEQKIFNYITIKD